MDSNWFAERSATSPTLDTRYRSIMSLFFPQPRRVPVPDDRFDFLVEHHKPARSVPFPLSLPLLLVICALSVLNKTVVAPSSTVFLLHLFALYDTLSLIFAQKIQEDSFAIRPRNRGWLITRHREQPQKWLKIVQQAMVKETNSQYLFFEFQSQRVNLGLSFLHDFLVSLVSYF